jgi:hypothetical protein
VEAAVGIESEIGFVTEIESEVGRKVESKVGVETGPGVAAEFPAVLKPGFDYVSDFGFDCLPGLEWQHLI